VLRARNVWSKEVSVSLFRILHSDSEYGLLLMIHILYSYMLNVASLKMRFRQIGSVGMLVG
jgi:hypothetical protein